MMWVRLTGDMHHNAHNTEGLNKGFITVELLMAFVVGTLFLSAAIMLTLGTAGSSRQYSLDGNESLSLDVSADREVGSILMNMYEESSSFVKLLSLPSELREIRNEVAYTLTPNFISPCSVRILLRADWEAVHGRSRYMNRHGIHTSPAIAHALGNNGCDPLPPSTWRAPTRSTSETGAGEIVGSPTAFASVRFEGKSYLVVVTVNSIQSNDLWVVDVTEPSSPTLISSLETGDATHVTGLLDVALVSHNDGVFAYALQNSGTNQLVVVNLDTPTTPTLVHTRSFESYGVNPLGSNPEGRVITYYNNRLYVGLRTTIGPEFLVFDIEDDPENPRFVGALQNSFDHSIYDIATNGEYAFLAIKPGNPPSGLPTRELMVIDVRGTPRDTGGGFNATTTANDTEGAMSLYLIGNRLYMGRERVSNTLERDLYVFNIASSTKPTYVKSRRLGLPTTSVQGTPRILDIVVQDTIAFLVTTDPTRSFQVYDVSRDDSTIIPILDNCATHVTIPRLTELFYFDNTVFTLFGLTAQVGSVYNNIPSCSP